MQKHTGKHKVELVEVYMEAREQGLQDTEDLTRKPIASMNLDSWGLIETEPIIRKPACR